MLKPVITSTPKRVSIAASGVNTKDRCQLCIFSYSFCKQVQQSFEHSCKNSKVTGVPPLSTTSVRLAKAPRYLKCNLVVSEIRTKRATNERNKGQESESTRESMISNDSSGILRLFPLFCACEDLCESLLVRLKHGKNFCRSWKPDFAQSAPSSRGFP